jgi:hypothetical protein
MVAIGKPGLLLGALMYLVPCFSQATQAQVLPGYMVFAANPQYPRTEDSANGREQSKAQKEKLSRRLIEEQYSSIADFRRNFGGASQVPVMINGNLTMFGRDWQRSVVMPILQAKLEGNYDYGLGNRDYEKNVGDCLLNSCAAGSIEDFKNRYWGKVENMDFGVMVSGRTDIYYGSLAYSRVIGDVHLVQLNNEPTYSVSFSSGWPLFNPREMYIGDALDWLERDLRKAREQGRIIILNMHKTRDWMGSEQQIERFRNMIQAYKVTAVFAGHSYWKSGRYWKAVQAFGTVPVFLSGSPLRQTYLIASVSADRQSMTVKRVEENDWSVRQLESVVEVQY